MALFHATRNVPVQVEVHVEGSGRNHADLAEGCFFLERFRVILNRLEHALTERVNGLPVGVDVEVELGLPAAPSSLANVLDGRVDQVGVAW